MEEKIFIDLIGRDTATQMFKKLGIEIDKTSGKLRDVKTGQFVSPKDITRMKNFNKELKKQKKSGFESFSVMLPLMFGFQQLGKAIESILQPADDLLGTQQIYKQFLAMKMLPAAEEQLEDVLDLGDSWDSLSEDTKLAQGRTYLLGKKMANLGSYVVQNAMNFGALGEAIPIVGRAMGTIGGIAFSLGTGLAALADENYSVVAAMDDVGTAATMMGMDWLSAVQKYIPGISAEIDKVKTPDLTTTEEMKTTASTEGQTLGSAYGDGVGTGIKSQIPNLGDILTGVYNTLKEKWNAFIGGTPSMATLFAITPQQVANQKTITELLQGPKGAEIGKEIQYFIGKGKSYTEASDIVLKAALGGYFGALQAGGIITRPTTALLGERGPEAVIPLDRIGSIGGINVTINTATIGGNVDMLAREIAEKFSFELSRVRY